MHVELATISTISPIRGRPHLVVRPQSQCRMSEQGPRFPSNTHSHIHTHIHTHLHTTCRHRLSSIDLQPHYNYKQTLIQAQHTASFHVHTGVFFICFFFQMSRVLSICLKVTKLEIHLFIVHHVSCTLSGK